MIISNRDENGENIYDVLTMPTCFTFQEEKGNVFFVGDRSGFVRMFDTRRGNKVQGAWEVHKRWVETIAVNPRFLKVVKTIVEFNTRLSYNPTNSKKIQNLFFKQTQRALHS